VVVDQCVIVNSAEYMVSTWYTTPTNDPWTHVTTVPDPNCPVVAPANGVLNNCPSYLLDTTSCSFACDVGYDLTGPATITCNNGVLSTLQTCEPTPPETSHCGILIAPGQCQVGFIGAPNCCTRISDQSPVASATVVGESIHFEITANVLPAQYEYKMGLSLTTTSFFTCEANPVTVTTTSATEQVNSWDVPVASLASCLNTQHVSPGLKYQGYVIMSLQFTPWGNAAFMGLYFFGVSIEFSNQTETVTVLTVTQELNGGGLNVLINPTATLRHCVTAPCEDEDPSYFSRVGDYEVYEAIVDTSGQAGSASVQSIFFEDINHHAIAALGSFQTLVNEGLNVTFGFTVPAEGAADVRYIRVTIQIAFNTGGSEEFQTETFVLLTQTKTYVAQMRFELFSAAASSSVTFSVLLLLAVLAMLF